MSRRLRWLAIGCGLALIGVSLTATSLAGSNAKSNLQVRVITATPLNAGTWDPQHAAGYRAVAKKQGWKLQVAELVPYGKATSVLQRWGDEGVDIVFSTDNGFERYMLDAAEKYPNTKWVIMSDMSTTRGLKNVGSYGVDSCEQGVLVGAAAALVSKNGNIGVDTSIPILPTKKELAGMAVGIKLVGSKAKMNIKYTGDFVDAAKAQEVASALIQDGADVITVPTNGGTSPETAKRVEQEGVPFIGENMDLSKFAPKQTVTSIILDFTRGYAEVGTQTASNKFQAKIRRLGFKDGFIRMLPIRTHKEITAKLKAIEAQLKAGKVNLAACKALK
jgi:basic membrane lipoprotein Med (substrate-binding protein (PBP1-ABC) superfamily)